MTNEEGSPSREQMSTLLMKEAPFRLQEKLNPVMKGTSTLNIREQAKYDTQAVHDCVAKPSKKVEKSHIGIKGDGEVWVEKRYRHIKTRESKIFFVSKSTGRKVPDEPPSGASHVIYLRISFIEERTNTNMDPNASSGGRGGGKYSSKEEEKEVSSPMTTPADRYALQFSGGKHKQLARVKAGHETPSKLKDTEKAASHVTPSPPNRLAASFLHEKFDGDFMFSDCDGFYNERPKLVKEKGSKDLSKDSANILEEQ
jgi:hypothetical protein